MLFKRGQKWAADKREDRSKQEIFMGDGRGIFSRWLKKRILSADENNPAERATFVLTRKKTA